VCTALASTDKFDLRCSRQWPSPSAFTSAPTRRSQPATRSSTAAFTRTNISETSTCKGGATRRKQTRRSSSSPSPPSSVRQRSPVWLEGGRELEGARSSEEQAKSFLDLKKKGINPVQSSIFGIAFHHHCSAMRRRRKEGVSGKAYFLSMRMTLMSISPVTHAVPSCLSLPDSHIFDAEQFNGRWIRDSAAISDLSRPKRSIYRSSITHGALLQRLLHCLSCSFACHPSIQGAVQFLSWSLGPLT